MTNMKLTLVNIYHKTGRWCAFVMLPVAEDGKVRIERMEMLNYCDPTRMIPRDHCVGYNV